ncbi:hypothetical protein [Virgisporangium ochraceum]|uniref:Uncharacterized protein n=1 Tax=Virgisporangium ochraceum TaxID=65505 RepID=A0A8J4EEX4_9ACTN|nr:hypothetical protein [Virgisporangium ochraceum]GIJ73060.1 hypothetical protein Voc01_079770 [Virgisporangium ochraceum]
MAPTSLVLGIAAEASTVSALPASPDGRILGTGRAAGANPSAYPMDLIADRLATAVSGALDGRGDRVPPSPSDQLSSLREALDPRPPIALRHFAGLVPAAAEAGDRVARRIADRPVRLLGDTFAATPDEVSSFEGPTSARRLRLTDPARSSFEERT